MPHSSKTVSMESFLCRRAAEKGFKGMRSLFTSYRGFDENTKWSDLPDYMLLFFGEDSDESELVIYDLIMGATGRERLCGCQLRSLNKETSSHLMDMYFYLTDQIRFECMRRIGWVSHIPESTRSIIEIIIRIDRHSATTLMAPPVLTFNHPGYLEAREAGTLEYSEIARKFIPEALETFRRKIIRRNKNECS